MESFEQFQTPTPESLPEGNESFGFEQIFIDERHELGQIESEVVAEEGLGQLMSMITLSLVNSAAALQLETPPNETDSISDEEAETRIADLQKRFGVEGEN